MTQSMINTVTERIDEMVKNVEIQKIMMSFKSNEEAQEWIIKSAIATLIVNQ
jgi:hypothetical protein